MQKFCLTLNELANPNKQRTKWKLIFLLEQARGDKDYSKTVILDDLQSGANRRYNEFEIDSSVFDIVGDYHYTAIQLDDDLIADLEIVEVGKMRIFEENNKMEFPTDSNTLIYG